MKRRFPLPLQIMIDSQRPSGHDNSMTTPLPQSSSPPRPLCSWKKMNRRNTSNTDIIFRTRGTHDAAGGHAPDINSCRNEQAAFKAATLTDMSSSTRQASNICHRRENEARRYKRAVEKGKKTTTTPTPPSLMLPPSSTSVRVKTLRLPETLLFLCTRCPPCE